MPRWTMSRLGSGRIRRGWRQPFVYGLVGLANSVIGCGVIFGLMACGVAPVPANAGGYVVGTLASFALNSKFTFGVAASGRRFGRFLVVAAIAYPVNLSVVVMVLNVFGGPCAAQAMGIVAYVAIGYIANKCWALRR